MSEHINTIFARFASHNPTPVTELSYTNSYTLLVAVVLSAQATDKSVNKATERLFAKVSTPKAMVNLGEAALKEHIKTIGLFNNKAKNIISLSQILLEQYQGKIPEHREDLEKLPGVGRKTANVVLNVAFNQPTIPVDTHIFRVAQRLGLAQGKTVLAIEEQLEARVPPAYKSRAHHWLILHGRYICKAQKPLCGKCFLADICPWPQKSSG
jgi:endonuclease-3